MFYRRLLIGIILIILGIIFIISGTPSSHVIEGSETWLQKMSLFFHSTWNKISGHKEASKYTAKSIGFLIGGIVLVLLGGLLIFRRLRSKK